MLHLKAGVALSSCLMSTLPTVCGNSCQCLDAEQRENEWMKRVAGLRCTCVSEVNWH